MKIKISVIMSTYNETEEELKKSIGSILNQTFGEFEFIIVNDNPANRILDSYLTSIQDSRVVILKNDENLGLVKSLNRALVKATGEIIVRADADDINMPDRIERQLNLLESKKLDLVGSYIDLIDDSGNRMNTVMKFPTEHKKINASLKWGSCLPHPTWMGRKKVFAALNGYRNTPHCEDYDLLIRAAHAGFLFGNVPDTLVQYRIRENGISKSNAAKQYVLREYLSQNRNHIPCQEQVTAFLKTDTFTHRCEKYIRFMDDKHLFRTGSKSKLLPMVLNRYFWVLGLEKLTVKLRK